MIFAEAVTVTTGMLAFIALVIVIIIGLYYLFGRRGRR